MKRWLPFASLFLLLFIWVAGCGGDDVRDDGDDDTTQDSGVIDARADGAGFGDGSTPDGSAVDGSAPDGSITDAGTDGSVIDAGNDSGIADAGQDAAVDSGTDSGVDAGVDAGADAGTFNVTGAAATNATTVVVTFDAVPDMATAQTASSYVITGGTTAPTVTSAVLSGSQVTLTTSTQEAAAYTLTVSGVLRSGDNVPLTVSTAAFTGVTTFNLASATTTSATTIDLTFDAPPDATKAQNTGNYTLLDVSTMTTATVLSAAVSGDVVTLTTMNNLGPVGYMVTVAGVTRDPDGAALTNDHVTFAGFDTFDVSSAVATTSTSATVTFSDAPDQATAETASNYVIMDASSNMLAVTSATLAGNVVTLTTDAQAAVTYTVKVMNVFRDPGAVALYADMAQFTGIAAGSAPTVTNVAVASTSPDNGTTPFNTGTTTLTLTGTGFTGVDCTTTIGVKLDDLDGAGAAVSTKATSCAVSSDTSLSATFPAGIRTNGATGWNVLVTNATGTNTTSSVPFVPLAGLLISEVYVGTAMITTHEYLEIYNPTTKDIDSAGIGLAVHIRNSSGSVDITAATTAVNSSTGIIKSHGFLLYESADSVVTDTWFSHADYKYTVSSGSGLVGDGSVFISLDATPASEARVIDKVGWGGQKAPGFETKATANLSSGNSIQRKPAGGLGSATDTDNNSTDFLSPSTSFTPQGSTDPIEP